MPPGGGWAKRFGTYLFGPVARRGVTLAGTHFDIELDGYLGGCCAATDLALGFSVKDRADVDYLRGRADLAVIGTQTIRLVEESGVAAVKLFIESLRAPA